MSDHTVRAGHKVAVVEQTVWELKQSRMRAVVVKEHHDVLLIVVLQHVCIECRDGRNVKRFCFSFQQCFLEIHRSGIYAALLAHLHPGGLLWDRQGPLEVGPACHTPFEEAHGQARIPG